MRADKAKNILRQAYDNTHAALWAILIAALVVFATSTLPHLPQAQAQYQTAKILEIQSEHEFYCRKWGFIAGSERYRGCLFDLQHFRRSVEKRSAEESIF